MTVGQASTFHIRLRLGGWTWHVVHAHGQRLNERMVQEELVTRSFCHFMDFAGPRMAAIHVVKFVNR